MGKYGEEGNQLIFQILKRGEHERPARPIWHCAKLDRGRSPCVVAQYQNELPKIFQALSDSTCLAA